MQRPAKPCTPVRFRPRPPDVPVTAPVAKLVDAWDLKSPGRNTVPVRVRPGAPNFGINRNRLWPVFALSGLPNSALLVQKRCLFKGVARLQTLKFFLSGFAKLAPSLCGTGVIFCSGLAVATAFGQFTQVVGSLLRGQ